MSRRLWSVPMALFGDNYVSRVLPKVKLLPRDASAERGDEIACRLSVCPSVCNDQVP